MRLDDIGRERGKRIMDPNSARTRSEVENSKKNSKKIKKKLKNNLTALFLAKTGSDRVR